MRLCCVVCFLLFSAGVMGQTNNYATLLNSSDNTDDGPNAHDSNLTTYASVRASTGVILVSPAYTGFVEVEFPSTLAAGTTSYLKLNTEQTLLGSLLGGALSGILGAVLTGQQEISVDVKNAAGIVVVTGDSQDPGELNTAKLTVVMNGAGEYFIKITPDVAYKRIRLTNRLGALLALGVVRRAYVYDAFNITNVPACAQPAFTSFTGSATLTTGQASVTNPQNAVDNNVSTYSSINIAAINVGPSVEQIVYMQAPTNATDSFDISLSAAQNVITAGISTNVTITAYNGTTAVQTKTLAQLLTDNGATMTGGNVVTLKMTPGGVIDRISVKLSAFLTLAQTLNLHNIARKPVTTVITQNNAICQGSTAQLIATTTSGNSLLWYDSAGATNLVATTSSGQVFTTPLLNANTIYYVGICAAYLTPVVVTVVSKPNAGSISGVQTVCNTNTPAVLGSVSAYSGGTITYRWESSLDEITWSPISGATGTTYQSPALLKSTFFRRITINTQSGISCESLPTASIKITAKNCMVVSNPMVRQRIKSGT